VHTFRYVLPESGEFRPERHGAYLIGADGVPLRGTIRTETDHVRCETRQDETLALSVLWPVRDFGRIQLETTRLPARSRPYLLNLELARHRLMRISVKREEWGLFDYPGMDAIDARIQQAQQYFITALQQIDEPTQAAESADAALSEAMHASEQMCLFHAEAFLSRRRQNHGFSRDCVGCAVPLEAEPAEVLRKPLTDVADFVRVPFTWRQIQPEERGSDFSAVDAWLQAAERARLHVRGGPLLNFTVRSVPDWMYLFENDYESILQFAREHVRRCVQRYKKRITSWVIASGLNADSVFALTFEQLMELTRAAVAEARKIAPRAQIVLDLTQPWGESYARSPHSVPPLLYAEMAVQAAIPFDALGLQFVFGSDADGYRQRDLFQIATLIDRFAQLSKPIHVTAVAVPSRDGAGGVWHRSWDAELQAEWYTQFARLALSRPYVESVCLAVAADGCDEALPHSGILAADGAPKPACEQLSELLKTLRAAPQE